jgi:ubiquinone/menaquinone biosynthesis C-methylase UbiE
LGLLRGLSGDVLDYGCGYGDLTYAISRTHHVCGIDIDPKRVRFARGEYPELELCECTADKVPFPDGSFDVVTSIVVIDFVKDAAAHLRMVNRVLRPGGHLIICCQNVPLIRNWLRRRLGRGPVPTDLWIRPRAEVVRLLATEGFEVVGESYFFDPPLNTPHKNLADVALSAIDLFCSVCRTKSVATYFLFLARRSGTPPDRV